MREAQTIVAAGLVLVPLAVMWLIALFDIITKRGDLSIGWKGIWSAVVILIPYVGVLIYAIVRFPAQVTGPAHNDSTATSQAIDHVHRLVMDHESGSITDEEFASDKAVVFGLAGP